MCLSPLYPPCDFRVLCIALFLSHCLTCLIWACQGISVVRLVHAVYNIQSRHTRLRPTLSRSDPTCVATRLSFRPRFTQNTVNRSLLDQLTLSGHLIQDPPLLATFMCSRAGACAMPCRVHDGSTRMHTS
jgi:hypothetical protein